MHENGFFFVFLFIYFCRELDLQENYIAQSIASIELINKHLGTPKTSSRPRVILFIVEIKAEQRQLNGSFFSLMAVGGGEIQATKPALDSTIHIIYNASMTLKATMAMYE
jgi:hypothetical protein